MPLELCKPTLKTFRRSTLENIWEGIQDDVKEADEDLTSTVDTEEEYLKKVFRLPYKYLLDTSRVT